MKLALAPLIYCWSKTKVMDFYQAMANTDIATFYIGEQVCRRRRLMKNVDYLQLAKMLTDQGKRVVLTSLALIESDKDFGLVEELAQLSQQQGLELELQANDLGSAALFREQGLKFHVGCAINCYNLASLKQLVDWGMVSYQPPVELAQEELVVLMRQAEEAGIRDQFELQVHAWGYLPLAYSARCFTARQARLTKDSCNTICQKDSNGKLCQTQDGQPLLRLNGIQTQSAHNQNLFADIPSLVALGADSLAISPNQALVPEKVAQMQQAIIEEQNLALGANDCNGYWYGKAGMATL
ncbi:U32 family peptidase [Paraferrimonas sedimenticola]|uniref:U32 family peptidase n=1 Tax=Paraferrimonas sedimenticola TaxID=375674 RepID=A0AA37RY22_9GAMM|nr:U32 family peptidase [Paraferrimonas sedimenticola]GLP96772.1 U32 family peptidase [Paraferrimonas sedimenticola]